MNHPINRMRPVHPGEILREDFLIPLNMSVNALALALNVPATRIHEIVKERRSITADTAERLVVCQLCFEEYILSPCTLLPAPLLSLYLSFQT